MSHREKLSPNYSKLEVALRSIGYSFEAAVADIVDNSLDASARSVLIRLITRRGKPMDLAIWDDGCGMSPSTLKEAMRFGSDINQEISRLGKFGLGLKLASLSQCRELRVISSENGKLSGCGWPEGGIQNEFTCEFYNAQESKAAINSILPDRQWRSGTLVWWSHLYRVGQNHVSAEEHAQKLLDRLRKYLALAFHRFLLGRRRKKVAISLDIFDMDAGTAGLPMDIDPLDPFGYPHSGDEGFPCPMKLDERYADRIRMVAHIWPPNSDEPNYRLPGGANSRQGFYFYRNDRLIQGGGWNGIREAEPHLSLARLEIDMAPDFDIEISLDVRKVEVHMPVGLAQAIQVAKSREGLDFKKYLALADSAYRTRKVTDDELPLIPSTGLPAKLSEYLHSELRIKATSRHRDLKIEWGEFDDDSFFDFDRDEGRLYLNQEYRRQLMHGLPGSSADIPVVKCLIFLLLRDAILSQRTGARVREQIDQLNRILAEAVKHERVRE